MTLSRDASACSIVTLSQALKTALAISIRSKQHAWTNQMSEIALCKTNRWCVKTWNCCLPSMVPQLSAIQPHRLIGLLWAGASLEIVLISLIKTVTVKRVALKRVWSPGSDCELPRKEFVLGSRYKLDIKTFHLVSYYFYYSLAFYPFAC